MRMIKLLSLIFICIHQSLYCDWLYCNSRHQLNFVYGFRITTHSSSTSSSSFSGSDKSIGSSLYKRILKHHHQPLYTTGSQLYLTYNNNNDVLLEDDAKRQQQQPKEVQSIISLFLKTTAKKNNKKEIEKDSLKQSVSENVKSTNNTIIKPYKIVIVGGGIGGLATASLLSSQIQQIKQLQQLQQLQSKEITTTIRRPFHITILEKNNYIGGRCGSFTVTIPNPNLNNGTTDSTTTINPTTLQFRHERGPSLLLLPHIYEQVFQQASLGLSSSSSIDEEDTVNNSIINSDDNNHDTNFNYCKKYNLHIKLCNPAYKVVFDDGDWIDIGFRRPLSGVMSVEEQISRTKMDYYESNGSTQWDNYMVLCNAYLNCGLPNFIQEQLNVPSFLEFIQQSIQNFGQSFPLKSHGDVIDTYFTSNKLKVLSSFQNLYVGLQPYNEKYGTVLTTTSPSVFGLLSAIELHPTNTMCGVYSPSSGGFQSVTNSFIQLIQSNSNISVQYQSTVTRITKNGVYYINTTSTTNDSTTTDESSVTTAEKVTESEATQSSFFHPADLIIVNADLPYATKVLMDDNDDDSDSGTNNLCDTVSSQAILNKNTTTTIDRYDWDDKYLYSSGIIAFHWSIRQVIHELNTSHTVFMIAATGRNDSEQSWNVLRSSSSSSSTSSSTSLPHVFQTPFNFYVHHPTIIDPTAAPPGMDTILVLVPCQTLVRNKNLSKLSKKQAIDEYTKQFTNEYISTVRQAVIERIQVLVPYFNETTILHEVIDTPATYANSYNVGAGTPFGLSHGLGQLSIFRPAGPRKGRNPFLNFLFGPNKNNDKSSSNNNNNILFVGASTKPGNGVPLVLTGAQLITKKAMKEIQRHMQL